MKLQVLFFSVLRDIVGEDRLQIEMPTSEGVTVASLLDQLYLDYPKLRDWDSSLLISADLDYVDRDAELTENQEVAIMPPVQGG